MSERLLSNDQLDLRIAELVAREHDHERRKRQLDTTLRVFNASQMTPDQRASYGLPADWEPRERRRSQRRRR